VLTPKQIQTLMEALDARFGADALWVFGSQASGQTHAESDIDLGVLFKRRPDPAQRFDTQAELSQSMGLPVDLVDLDTASPALAMQVLRHGKLLIDRNPRRRIAFTAILPSRYEDLRRLREPMERKIAERMRHGRT